MLYCGGQDQGKFCRSDLVPLPLALVYFSVKSGGKEGRGWGGGGKGRHLKEAFFYDVFDLFACMVTSIPTEDRYFQWFTR